MALPVPLLFMRMYCLIATDNLSYRVCFFIDGLDEFDGDEVDHWRLARDLQSWTQSENIKLCVSSRPHVPFLHSFDVDANIQIHIHRLTRGDIRNFGLAMFELDPNFDRIRDSYKSLVDEIVESAKGVFLWARLVVRSLLAGVDYRSTREELSKKLHSIPKELDALFDQLFQSVSAEDQRLSDKLFLIIATPIHDPGYVNPNSLPYFWDRIWTTRTSPGTEPCVHMHMLRLRNWLRRQRVFWLVCLEVSWKYLEIGTRGILLSHSECNSSTAPLVITLLERDYHKCKVGSQNSTLMLRESGSFLLG